LNIHSFYLINILWLLVRRTLSSPYLTSVISELDCARNLANFISPTYPPSEYFRLGDRAISPVNYYNSA